MLGLGGGGGGEELVKEVDLHLCFAFAFILCYYFVQGPFCDVQWLAGSPFYKAVILYSLLFQNLDPFSNQTFCGFA